MKLSIITPCCRPNHLDLIRSSFTDDFEDWHWYIVYDGNKVDEEIKKFENDPKVTEWSVKGEGCMGNDQRNYALDQIDPETDTMIYFLDDDNTIHPGFFSEILPQIQNIPDVKQKLITFDQWRHYQIRPWSHVLPGNEIALGCIDTAMCLVHRYVIGDSRWISSKYEADFHFFNELYEKVSKENHLYLPHVGALYNNISYTHYFNRHSP